MRVAIRVAAWTLVVVAIGSAAAAWLRDPPELGADDAIDVALGALESIGHDADLDGPVERGVHTTEQGRDIEAWFVRAHADGGPVELGVRASAGELIYVDDLTADNERVLTDDEFERLGAYRDDAVVDRWVLRNSVGSVAALFVAAVALALSQSSRPQEPVIR